LHTDVEVGGTYINLLRAGKKFSILQPSASDRLDIGIKLKGVLTDERFETAGTWNAMVTPGSDSESQPSAELKPQKGKLTFRSGVRVQVFGTSVAALSIAGGPYSFCLVERGAKRRHTPGVSPVRAEKTRVK